MPNHFRISNIEKTCTYKNQPAESLVIVCIAFNLQLEPDAMQEFGGRGSFHCHAASLSTCCGPALLAVAGCLQLWRQRMRCSVELIAEAASNSMLANPRSVSR